jgi:cell division protein FtsZ
LSRQGARRTAPPLQVLRTGTDNQPIAHAQAGATATGPGMAGAATDFSDISTRPAVWRQPNRTQAAQRVDALVMGGMDDIDIPAYLRKQAD